MARTSKLKRKPTYKTIDEIRQERGKSSLPHYPPSYNFDERFENTFVNISKTIDTSSKHLEESIEKIEEMKLRFLPSGIVRPREWVQPPTPAPPPPVAIEVDSYRGSCLQDDYVELQRRYNLLAEENMKLNNKVNQASHQIQALKDTPKKRKSFFQVIRDWFLGEYAK